MALSVLLVLLLVIIGRIVFRRYWCSLGADYDVLACLGFQGCLDIYRPRAIVFSTLKLGYSYWLVVGCERGSKCVDGRTTGERHFSDDKEGRYKVMFGGIYMNGS